MGCGKRLGKVFQKVREGSLQGDRTGNENIIGTFVGGLGQDGLGGGPKAALGAIALDRASNLPAGGKSQAETALLGRNLGCGAGFEG